MAFLDDLVGEVRPPIGGYCIRRPHVGESAGMPQRSSLSNALLLLVLIIGIGVAGYMTIGGLAPLDALYMTITTLSTVGYREVAPMTPAVKVFTIALILGGFGVVLYSASLAAGDDGRMVADHDPDRAQCC